MRFPYTTLFRSESLEIEVEGRASSGIASSESAASSEQVINRQPVSAGKQFRYIKLRTHLHNIDSSGFFKSGLFWTLLVFPVVLLSVVIVVGDRKSTRLNSSHVAISYAV